MPQSQIRMGGFNSKGCTCKEWLLLLFDSMQYTGFGMMRETLNFIDGIFLIPSSIKILLVSTHPGTVTQRQFYYICPTNAQYMLTVSCFL
jgi:hypothetical protein